MAVASVAPEQEQKKDAFDKETKISGEEWSVLTLLALLIGLFSTLIFFSATWIGILVCIVLTVVVLVLLTTVFWAFVSLRRNCACSQCFQLSEEIGLNLSQEQVVQLQRLGTGGWVFLEFVRMIPLDRLAQPKAHYFAVGNWENSAQCRQFVRFLHNNPGVFLPEPVRSATDESEQPEDVGGHVEPDERPQEEPET